MTDGWPNRSRFLSLMAGIFLVWHQPVLAGTARATSVGVYVEDIYGDDTCPDNPVKVDLWFHNGTAFEFHNRCYLNAASAPERAGLGVCYFKYPMPIGTPAGSILVRSWKMNADCSQYLDAIAPDDPSSYTDYHPNGDVIPDEAYDAYPDRLIRMEADDYAIAIDRNGGAIYEFYNKRASDTSLPAGKTESAIHAHYGAALQVAIHSGQPGSLTNDPCAGQGYWNPTQAGCACSYHDGATGPDQAPAPGTANLQISCDGVPDNACASASRTVHHSLFNMMNWDYGPDYEGPYHDLDTSHLEQTITAHDHYLQVDVRLRNTGLDRTACWETPTFYFTNRFRRYFYPDPDNADVIQQVEIPVNLTGIDADNYRASYDYVDIPWMTFENRGVSTGGDHFITIGFMIGRAMLADLNYLHVGVGVGGYFDNVRFSYSPRMHHYYTDMDYHFRYVVFPYRYDELVTTVHGTLSVADTIAAMYAEYLNRAPIGWLDGVTDTGQAWGWTLDPDTPEQSIAFHLYLDGPAGTGTLLSGDLADVPRADVNQNTGYPGDHGFEIKLPGSVFDGQPHDLYAYGIDAQGTKNVWLNGSPNSFTLTPKPDGGEDGSADAGPDENERGDTDAGSDGVADEDPGSDGCGCRASGGSDSKCGVLLLLLGLLVILKKSGRV